MPELVISWSSPHDSDVRVARCRGDIDMASSPALLRCVETLTAGRPAPDSTRLVLELHDVTFIDTGGVRAIARAQDAARCRGVSVVLRNPSAFVGRLLALTGMASDFTVEQVPATLRSRATDAA